MSTHRGISRRHRPSRRPLYVVVSHGRRPRRPAPAPAGARPSGTRPAPRTRRPRPTPTAARRSTAAAWSSASAPRPTAGTRRWPSGPTPAASSARACSSRWPPRARTRAPSPTWPTPGSPTTPSPQWTIKLHPGVKFHDGERLQRRRRQEEHRLHRHRPAGRAWPSGPMIGEVTERDRPAHRHGQPEAAVGLVPEQLPAGRLVVHDGAGHDRLDRPRRRPPHRHRPVRVRQLDAGLQLQGHARTRTTGRPGSPTSTRSSSR